MYKREQILFLQDILDSINAIDKFTSKLNFDEFSAQRMAYSATIREFRTLLIHEYFGVDAEIVWNTVKNDLPHLKSVVIDMIKKEG